MKCPDLSIPITFHSGIGIVVNATCAEYFEPVDPCSGISCQENASCTPKDNSYECSCNEGYTNSNNSTDSSAECTKLINECENGTHECHQNAFCFDTKDSYGCICEDGFDGDGFDCSVLCFEGTKPSDGICVDIDECASNSTICETPNTICENSFGSYSCVCPDGFIGDEKNCSQITTTTTTTTTSTTTSTTTTTTSTTITTTKSTTTTSTATTTPTISTTMPITTTPSKTTSSSASSTATSTEEITTTPANHTPRFNWNFQSGSEPEVDRK